MADLAARAGRSGRAFLQARAEGRGALVAYLPVGYPDVATSLAAMRAVCGEGDAPGVDLVEIGLPYSDPILDGPVIQRAGTQAIARGVRTLLHADVAVSTTGVGGADRTGADGTCGARHRQPDPRR